MKNQLADLLDIPRLQSALDSLYTSSKIPSAIIDNDGKVHTGSGWQDVCTKFHRVHPEARKRCIQSDLYIKDHIHEANPSITYKCPHGLVDTATPIIIEGEHIGNVFTGQLFLEEPDLDCFRAQAKAFGFDEEKYIDAVKKVPIITEQTLQENLAFVAHLTGMLAEMGLKREREKETETRFRDSEERYRSLFGKASEGISIISPDGHLIEVNESFARMHGYSTAELLQMNIKDLDTPKTAMLIPERMRRLLAEEILSIEVEHHHKDGHVFPMEVSANLISIGGEPFIQCFHRDITDRRRAEEELRRTNELFRSAFEEAPGGMCLVSPEGRFLRVNNAFCTMLERPESELPGMAFMDVTHPEDRSASREWVGKILAGEEVPKTLEKRYLRKSGHVLWGIVGSFLLRSDDGVPLFFITHIQDITDRKRAEAEKEKLQAQLQQAIKMEAVGRLAGGVAHDFNNLLTVITGYSELLLRKIGKKSSMHGQVEEIRRAGERAASLTQQLLAFSRKQIIEPKVVHLGHLVAEMHKMLTRLIGEDISLQATTGKSLGSVKVDPGQF